MKRIIIGRANDSDIVIPDEHDNVSRHHAVITFNFFGKMTLSDTSSNGTLINGTKMLKGTSIPVTRKDKIQLGGAWIFDWSLVEDPYKSLRRNFIIMSAVLIIIAIGGISWYVYDSFNSADTTTIEIPKSDINDKTDSWNKDSTNKVAPTEVNIKTSNSTKPEGKNAKAKKRTKKVIKKKTQDVDLLKMEQRKDAETKYEKEEMPVIN